MQLDLNTALLILLVFGVAYVIFGMDKDEDVKTSTVTVIQPRGRRWGSGWRRRYQYGWPYYGRGYRRYYW